MASSISSTYDNPVIVTPFEIIEANKTVSIAAAALKVVDREPKPLHTRIITVISDAIQSACTAERNELFPRLLVAFFIVALPVAAILDTMQGRPLLPDP